MNKGEAVVEEKFSTAALLQNTEALYESFLESASARPSPTPRANRDPSRRLSIEFESHPGYRPGRDYDEHATHRHLSVRKANLTPLTRSGGCAPSFDILGGQAVQAARLITRLREVPSLRGWLSSHQSSLPGSASKAAVNQVSAHGCYVASLLHQFAGAVPKLTCFTFSPPRTFHLCSRRLRRS